VYNVKLSTGYPQERMCAYSRGLERAIMRLGYIALPIVKNYARIR
jgi:hypothetical protein